MPKKKVRKIIDNKPVSKLGLITQGRRVESRGKGWTMEEEKTREDGKKGKKGSLNGTEWIDRA